MSNRLHLPEIALTAALIAAPSNLVFGQKSAPAQSLPPVPATPNKYDFKWEAYTVNAAQGGKAFYVFEGQQPVGIGVLRADGTPEIFPLVSGTRGEQLKASFNRFQKASGITGTPLSKTPTASVTRSSRPAPTGGGTPLVTFNANEIHVSLNDGTRVDFLDATIEVTMPAAVSGLPGTTIGFDFKIKGGKMGRALSGMGLTMNGEPMKWQRKGPVWEGIKDLFLTPALYKAAQAAHIGGKTLGRPADAPDYVVLVADIERAFGIVPISFF